jgi:hypothetical protein
MECGQGISTHVLVDCSTECSPSPRDTLILSALAVTGPWLGLHLPPAVSCVGGMPPGRKDPLQLAILVAGAPKGEVLCRGRGGRRFSLGVDSCDTRRPARKIHRKTLPVLHIGSCVATSIQYDVHMASARPSSGFFAPSPCRKRLRNRLGCRGNRRSKTRPYVPLLPYLPWIRMFSQLFPVRGSNRASLFSPEVASRDRRATPGPIGTGVLGHPSRDPLPSILHQGAGFAAPAGLPSPTTNARTASRAPPLCQP